MVFLTQNHHEGQSHMYYSTEHQGWNKVEPGLGQGFSWETQTLSVRSLLRKHRASSFHRHSSFYSALLICFLPFSSSPELSMFLNLFANFENKSSNLFWSQGDILIRDPSTTLVLQNLN